MFKNSGKYLMNLAPADQTEESDSFRQDLRTAYKNSASDQSCV
jgi:hypothetical protein